MSNLSDIGNLMHLHLDYIKPGKETNANKFLIFATAHNLTRMEGRNWIPVIVKEVGEDQYQVIGNSFIYEAAKEAELEKLWCIIADDNPETDELVKVLAREQTPRINLSTASKEEIQLALDFLTKRDPTLFKGVRVSFFINRLYKAPRQYWRSLEPIIRLKCNVNKGRKLDALEEVFYLTPQRQRILNLRNLSLKELKDIARAQGVIRYTQKTKTELLELFLK